MESLEKDGWKLVSFAADCGVREDGDLDLECSLCGLDYVYECQCPGPTQEELYEYREIDGVLYARPWDRDEGQTLH